MAYVPEVLESFVNSGFILRKQESIGFPMDFPWLGRMQAFVGIPTRTR
jgi:hypothetical protein